MTRYDPQWVAHFYDNYGDDEWHRWEKSPADEVKLHVHRFYLEQYVKSGDQVLEVGSGAGRFTQILGELGARVVVADVSSVQLELNRRHAEELAFEHAVQGRLQLDMCDMDALKDDAFDAVVCYGGPLSYVFECRDAAVCEVFRVLKPSGTALFSVMSLWGALHEFLPAVMEVPSQENAQIISTGDLHPETYRACEHRCHLFRGGELHALLEDNGATVVCVSASNCLSAAWGERLSDVRSDPVRWQELLGLEVEACREPGCLDSGTHVIAVARKSQGISD